MTLFATLGFWIGFAAGGVAALVGTLALCAWAVARTDDEADMS